MAASRIKQRIVSLAPSVTSILVALGAKENLVGVSKWCLDVAPEVEKLPRVGDCWSLEPESVMSLGPTLLIGSVPFKQETVAKILEQPVAFIAMNPRSLGDVEADIHLLGRVVGRAQAAKRVVANMRADFQRIRAKAKRRGGAALRVYCESWPNPRIVSPPWVAELVEIAGGKMAVAAGKRISDEEVAAAAPDVMVLAWAATGGRSDPRQAYEAAAWRDVPAIRNRQVYVVRDELLNTPAPILVRGARELARVFDEARGVASDERNSGGKGRRRK